MRLFRLIKAIGDCRISGKFADVPLGGVACDSKLAGKNFVFVAVKGTHRDGNLFIPEAVANGAGVIVTAIRPRGHAVEQDVTFIRVENDRLALSRIADAFYAHPSGKVKVVGITGTNGKTTISYLLEAALGSAGMGVGVVGTVNYRFKGRVADSHNTTPGPLELQEMLWRMKKEGVDFAVVEVSSHSLEQERVGGIDFHSAIFTNLTQDHLDYHRDMENYFRAKSRLFEGLKPAALAVINNDDPYAGRIKEVTSARIVTYALDNPADATAEITGAGTSGVDFIFKYRGFKTAIHSSLIGKHNVYNLLAVFSWAAAAGLSLPKLASVLVNFSRVPGRLERIENDKGVHVFVDYAHTEDALRNVLMSLRQIAVKPGRLIVVFGCGGERDRGKRPKMGLVATTLADYAVITSDNPRSEDPAFIAEEVRSGITGSNYEMILDRGEAIARALTIARAGDVVLLAGKGHENYQVFRDSSVHFDDREVAREILTKR